jgi:hypothetical protein
MILNGRSPAATHRAELNSSTCAMGAEQFQLAKGWLEFFSKPFLGESP